MTCFCDEFTPKYDGCQCQTPEVVPFAGLDLNELKKDFIQAQERYRRVEDWTKNKLYEKSLARKDAYHRSSMELYRDLYRSHLPEADFQRIGGARQERVIDPLMYAAQYGDRDEDWGQGGG